MAGEIPDDIIKQRNIRPGNKPGNRNIVKDVGGGQGRGRLIKGRPNLIVGPPAQGVIGDARNKIIQKKRLRFRDARDRLAEIAKQGDARDKINKNRKFSNATQKNPVIRKTPRLMDENMRNENFPSYLGGQTRMQGTSLIRTVAGGDGLGKGNVIVRGKPTATNFSKGLQRQIPSNSRPQSVTRTRDGERYHPLPNNPHVVTIKNDKADFYNPSYQQVARQQELREPPVKLTARNPPIRSMGLSSAGSQTYSVSGMRSDAMMRARSPEHRLYRSRKSPEMEEIRPTRLKITTANNFREQSPQYSDEWESPPRLPSRVPAARAPATRVTASRAPPPRVPARIATRSPAKKRPAYDDEDVETVTRPKKMAPLSSGLMARLDQPQRSSAPQGFKVLVTNLHHCVSVEDMEELFGTIGPIIDARIVREGIAEAVFLNEEDAFRSVEVFNNRQLDGQPMSVTVVNKKSSSLSAPPPPPIPANPRTQTKSVLKAASGSSLLTSGRGTAGLPGLKSSRKEEQVAPDLSTIRQALFNRSHPPASDHTFLVKLPKAQSK